MGIEIERRFIVQGIEWKHFINSFQDIKQGYLTSDQEEWAVRIRIINDKESLLTLKSASKGMARHEFEYEIPLNDGTSLLKLCQHKLTKRRFTLNVEQSIWIVDSFTGQNSSLVLAEIELDSEDERIKIPTWCSKEITGKKIWSNADLARWPITIWPIEKRLKEQILKI